MAEDNLQLSLDAYKLQLNQVNSAIGVHGTGEDIQELLQLKEDLTELIKLTEESLLSLQKSNLLGMVEKAPTTRQSPDLDDEMKTFYSELNQQETQTNEKNSQSKDLDEMEKYYAELNESLNSKDKSQNANLQGSSDVLYPYGVTSDIKDGPSSSFTGKTNGNNFYSDKNNSSQNEEASEIDPLNEEFLDSIEHLEDISGVKCQAPYVTEWSGIQYHNAMIKGPVENDDGSNGDIFMKVLFLNPVLPSMRPCPYFLEGHCRFDETNCKFCHGHKISLFELRPYVDHDYGLLEEGADCLAKFTDGIWKPGVVENILENHTYKIKFSHENVTLEVDIKDLIPNVAHSAHEDSLPSDSDEDIVTEIQSDGHYTTSQSSSSSLGAWEAHTRGIASKLMEKMGYKIGQGLGKTSQGRLEPVPIVLLPPGKSLDHCMQIKEKKGVKNLDTNIKTAHDNANTLEKKPRSTRRKRGSCVFSFLNKTLGDKKMVSQVNHRKKPQDMFGIKEGKDGKNSKKFNKEIFRNEEEMKKMEMKVKRLKESIRRNEERNPSVAKAMRAKLKDLQETLGNMKEFGIKIKLDQKRMETHRKMTLF